jgi:hypothetical protein
MTGADIRHFVFLANAEHTLKILYRMLSVSLTFCSVCLASFAKKKKWHTQWSLTNRPKIR